MFEKHHERNNPRTRQIRPPQRQVTEPFWFAARPITSRARPSFVISKDKQKRLVCGFFSLSVFLTTVASAVEAADILSHVRCFIC
jgi:hypothetical protein